jgi:2,3-bisphosphoglycerate-dependent phosphoglycerate mutase
MKDIYLVRHCRAVGQDSDAPLTVEGREQAEGLIHFFKNRSIEFVITSPYIRAVDTIKPLSNKLNIKVHIDERLKERVLSTIDYPDWMNKLEQTYIDENLRFEGGETTKEARSRGMEVIYELLIRPETNMIVVTHGALLSIIIKHYINEYEFGFNDWRKLSNPDIFHLRIKDSENYLIKRIWE